MKVSVIIPVYQAERFVADAIASALAQPETYEVIIVEDGSSDGSLAVCEACAERDSRVKIFRHPGGVNMGTGASFNLGMENATGELIGFLGADDQYVPGAFAAASKVFLEHTDAEGVYGTIGVLYHDPEYKALHLSRIPGETTGMRSAVSPEGLLAALLDGRHGHISLDGLLVRSVVLAKGLVFDVTLRQGQDMDLMYRLAAIARLYPLVPDQMMALRGVHRGNRVFNFEEAAHYRRAVLRKCIEHRFYGCQDKQACLRVVRRYLESRLKRVPAGVLRKLARQFVHAIYFMTHPGLALRLMF